MRTITILVGVVISAVFFLVTGVASAGEKIGIVDMEKILHNSMAAKSARAMFLMEIEAKKGVLKSKEQEIRSMEMNHDDPDKHDNDGRAQKRQEKIALAVKELRRLRDDMEEELKKKERELQQKMIQEIKEIVQAYKNAEKYVLILEKGTVLAFEEAMDITDEITRIYDARRR